MIIGLSIVVLLAAAVVLLTCFAPRDNAAGYLGTDSSFLENFSLGAYRPMLRLASQMDRRFLSAAHSEVLAKCYRKVQRNLLREYLREASQDFNRLNAIATARTLRANSDPDDLSVSLLEQQMTFVMLVWAIEARLLLDNFLPFSVNLRPLVAQLEGLAQQARELARPQYSYQTF